MPRLAWAGVGLVALAVIAVAAELSYRAVVKGQIRALEREVLRQHPAARFEHP